jgi:hypothetical protein
MPAKGAASSGINRFLTGGSVDSEGRLLDDIQEAKKNIKSKQSFL